MIFFALVTCLLLKGKTTSKTPFKVVLNKCDNLTEGILQMYSDVTLAVDII